MIKVKINSEEREIQKNLTVNQLLQQLKIIPEQVAVEYNETILKRSQFVNTVIQQHDQLEIIHFIGGGAHV